MTQPADSTPQVAAWSGRFGHDYTDRNPQTSDEMNQLYVRQYGVTRRGLNEELLGNLDRQARILEVGSNVGAQLVILQEMGFTNLYGLELQRYAVELSKRRTEDIDIIQGNALDLPFKDAFFDLVFTSGLLMLISPDDLPLALDEIHRCTRQYIWGFEDFAEQPHEATYRGQSNLVWRRDFAQLFLDRFEDLRLRKEKRVQYQDMDAADQMYLLERRPD